MLRKIVEINEEKCVGCGLCIDACHEGALQMVNGKARLVSDSYCDGLGACLPQCPVDAINIIEREAAAFDEAAVEKHVAAKTALEQQKLKTVQPASANLACGCPGSSVRLLDEPQDCSCNPGVAVKSQLRQWPCQIKLVPVNAPFLKGADLLIAADCCAYAYANFHQDFISKRVTVIGCPKLDDGDYTEKFTEMFRLNDIKSITITRMTVPCCGSLVTKVKQAVANSGRDIPVNVVSIDPSGEAVGM